MKVYIIEYTDWDEHYILGVFSTPEKAAEHFQKLESWEKDRSDIVEHEVN